MMERGTRKKCQLCDNRFHTDIQISNHMSSNDNHHWGGRYPPPSRGRGYRRGGGQFHRQPQGGHRPPGRDAPPPYHPHGNTNQHQPRQQSHHNQNRFNPHEGGVRDHHHYDHKRQKTGHSSSGNNNNNSSSSDYYGGNNATHRLRQDNTPGPSIPQAQSEAVEIPQNSLGSTRNEAEPTSASTNPETTTTTATRTDLTHATTTCGDENSVPLIDTKDEYLPFRKDSTGYWNDPTILQEKLVAAVRTPLCVLHLAFRFVSEISSQIRIYLSFYSQLPSDAQALRKLPPHKYEPDFKERLQRSYTTVMRRLLAEVAKRPPASGGYSSSSDYDSDDDYDRVDMRAPPTDPVLAQRKLLKEVAENPAVHFGFQCYSAKEFDMWCCCPMGQKLQKERYTGCGSHSRMRPRDFVAHLISEHSGKGPLNDHKVVYQFLECLYSKVYQDRNNIRYDHEAITNDMKQRNGFWRVRNAEEYRYVQDQLESAFVFFVSFGYLTWSISFSLFLLSLLLSGIEQENALMESFQALKLQLDESANQIDEDFHVRGKLIRFLSLVLLYSVSLTT